MSDPNNYNEQNIAIVLAELKRAVRHDQVKASGNDMTVPVNPRRAELTREILSQISNGPATLTISPDRRSIVLHYDGQLALEGLSMLGNNLENLRAADFLDDVSQNNARQPGNYPATAVPCLPRRSTAREI